MRGCPVVSSLFSSGLAPQVGQRTACTRLTFGFLAFMVIDGAANSHIRVGISCTATHRIEIVDARQTPQAARPKLHSAAASEVLAQIKMATAKIANPSSHIRSRRRGWIGSRCAGCRTEACSLRSGSGDLASLKRGRLGYLWVGRSLTRGSIVGAAHQRRARRIPQKMDAGFRYNRGTTDRREKDWFFAPMRHQMKHLDF